MNQKRIQKRNRKHHLSLDQRQLIEHYWTALSCQMKTLPSLKRMQQCQLMTILGRLRPRMIQWVVLMKTEHCCQMRTPHEPPMTMVMMMSLSPWKKSMLMMHVMMPTTTGKYQLRMAKTMKQMMNGEMNQKRMVIELRRTRPMMDERRTKLQIQSTTSMVIQSRISMVMQMMTSMVIQLMTSMGRQMMRRYVL
jgi:hypothetical protein